MKVKGSEDHPWPRVCCVYVTPKLLLIIISLLLRVAVF